MGTSRIEKKQKDKIKKTAFLFFLENGYSNTSTRQIAEKAEMQRGQLYYYYPKKEYILSDMFYDYLHCFLDFWRDNYGKKTTEPTFICVSAVILLDVLCERCNLLDEEIISSNLLINCIIQENMNMYIENKSKAVTEEIQTVHKAHIMAFGAGSHLLYANTIGLVRLSNTDISLEASRIFYKAAYAISDKKIDNLLNEAKKDLKEFSTADFISYLKEKCSWYQTI